MSGGGSFLYSAMESFILLSSALARAGFHTFYKFVTLSEETKN
jgi:hypothetical protein